MDINIFRGFDSFILPADLRERTTVWAMTASVQYIAVSREHLVMNCTESITGRKCGRGIDVRAFETAEMGKRLAEFKLEKTIGFFWLDFFLVGTN